VKPFGVLVVDDEAPARNKVKRLLAADARFAVLGEAADGLEALARVESLRPELLLLDVQMPGLTGLELVEALAAGPVRPLLLFSTAYDQYAVPAFDAAAVDYLLKPYDADRFTRALERAFQRLQAARGPEAELGPLLLRLRRGEGGHLARLLVREGEEWLPLPLDRVVRLCADDKYVRVFSDRGEHLVRQALGTLEARLDPARFVRVHRSEIVALDAVLRLSPWSHGDALLTLRGGASAVLSRTYRDEFLRRWGGG
jgi:two-component system LytT family response regulator